MTTTNKVIVKANPRSDYARHYHTNFSMATTRVPTSFADPSRIDLEKNLGPEGASLYIDLFANVHGITAVTLSKFQLTVVRAELFTWKEIDKDVLAVLHKRFGDFTIQDRATKLIDKLIFAISGQ